ncbi:MAG: hypothetical protein ACJAU0_000637 [Flavobacteriales bacterium]|jgi:hypothetical protein
MKYTLLLLTLILSACAFGQSKQTIESCEYDPINNRFFVSNQSNILMTYDLGDSWEVFGSGSANYGMEVMGSTLFVIKNASVFGYDLTTGDEVMEIIISGSLFLNGMGNDGSNNLFVSDFNGDKIYKIDVSDLDNPSFETIIDNIAQPNGIVIDNANNRGVFVSWGTNPAIKAFDLDTYAVTNVATGTGLSLCDGVDLDNDGNFYVSSWAPMSITKFNNDFSTSETVSTSGLESPADISYGLEVNILGIANSGSDEVTFIEFSGVTVAERESEFSFQAFPNPIVDQVNIAFELEQSALVSLRILNVEGKTVANIAPIQLNQGTQQLKVDQLDLPTGIHFIELTVNDQVFTERILVN